MDDLLLSPEKQIANNRKNILITIYQEKTFITSFWYYDIMKVKKHFPRSFGYRVFTRDTNSNI